jgi:hypothetical protein
MSLPRQGQRAGSPGDDDDTTTLFCSCIFTTGPSHFHGVSTACTHRRRTPVLVISSRGGNAPIDLDTYHCLSAASPTATHPSASFCPAHVSWSYQPGHSDRPWAVAKPKGAVIRAEIPARRNLARRLCVMPSALPSTPHQMRQQLRTPRSSPPKPQAPRLSAASRDNRVGSGEAGPAEDSNLGTVPRLSSLDKRRDTKLSCDLLNPYHQTSAQYQTWPSLHAQGVATGHRQGSLNDFCHSVPNHITPVVMLHPHPAVVPVGDSRL